MESNCSLPTELIYRIVCFLCPQDIVRLRTVSKQFRAVAHDPTLWRTLYTHARLPRYPGPFPTQSIEFLERTLVQSEQLTKSWTTQPMQCVSNIEIQNLGVSSQLPQIIDGKWIVGCESHRSFVVYNIDLGTSRVLWGDDARRARHPVRSWSAISIVIDDDMIIYVVFSDVTPSRLSSPWKLLEFRVDGGSGHLYHSLTLDVPTRIPEEIVCLNGQQTPFLYIITQQLVFDARTKLFYEFPEFHSPLLKAPLNWCFVSTLLTKTHVIRIRRVFDPAVSPPAPLTLIQAFIPPTESRSVSGAVGTLHLSHEGTLRNYSENYKIIRNSITDDVTGCVNVRLLLQSVENRVMDFSCVDLTLPKLSRADAVLLMTADSHDVAQLNCGRFSQRQHMTYIESSNNGHARGFVRFSDLNRRVKPALEDFIVKFTIDGSGERCIATLGPITMTRVDISLPFAHIWFDNVRGRLCYTKGGAPPSMRSTSDMGHVVVVMDIK